MEDLIKLHKLCVISRIIQELEHNVNINDRVIINISFIFDFT